MKRKDVEKIFKIFSEEIIFLKEQIRAKSFISEDSILSYMMQKAENEGLIGKEKINELMTVGINCIYMHHYFIGGGFCLENCKFFKAKDEKLNKIVCSYKRKNITETKQEINKEPEQKEWIPQPGTPVYFKNLKDGPKVFDLYTNMIDNYSSSIKHESMSGHNYLYFEPAWEMIFLLCDLEYDWIAMDEDGHWYNYKVEPLQDVYNFYSKDIFKNEPFPFIKHPDWKNSKMKKPDWIKKLQEEYKNGK